MNDDIAYRVTIENDSDCENPTDNDGSWKLYSFSRRHTNYRDPASFQDDHGNLSMAIRNKMRVGLAHFLSYYEHGQCMWSLDGHGPRCDFDTVDKAGIAVWEEPPGNMGAKTFDDRAKDCASVLEEYTDWCNGNCYWYSIESLDPSGDPFADITSCGGFIGEKWMAEIIREEMPTDADEDNTEIIGEAAWIAERHDIFKPESERTEYVPKQVYEYAY